MHSFHRCSLCSRDLDACRHAQEPPRRQGVLLQQPAEQIGQHGPRRLEVPFGGVTLGQTLERLVMEAEQVVVEPIVPTASMVGVHRVDPLRLGDPTRVDHLMSGVAASRSAASSSR
jgi:hypothetical protein